VRSTSNVIVQFHRKQIDKERESAPKSVAQRTDESMNHLSYPPTTTISHLAMSSKIPAELWQHICDDIIDRCSLLKASQICHSWRVYVLPRLFECITLNTMGGPWQETQLEIDQGLRFIIPLVRRVVVVALHQKSPRLLSDSDLHQISAAIRALLNLRAIMVQTVRFGAVNDLLLLVALTNGTSRELELSLVDVEVLSAQQPQNVPETNVVSLALSESSWHVVDSFSFISSLSMTHLRRLQFTFVSRHDIAWWFDEVCDLVQTPHYSLLELALDSVSLLEPRGTAA
jgi:hypothetical protein